MEIENTEKVAIRKRKGGERDGGGEGGRERKRKETGARGEEGREGSRL